MQGRKKIDLLIFGGRGAGAGGAGGGSMGTGDGGTGEFLPLAGQTGFFDGNKVSVASTLKHWEGKSAGLDHEELLMTDEQGFAVGYFKGGKTAVGFSIPDGQDTSKLTITHNHPVGSDGRTIGGSFSNADLQNHIRHGFKETRATAKEGTYSFKAAKGAKQNPNGFLSALSRRQNECSKKASKRYQTEKARGSTKPYIDTYLQVCHEWYNKNAKKYGYDYSFTPAN